MAVQALYLAFGSKANMLADALGAVIVGDNAPVPLIERPWINELRAEEDGRRAVVPLCRENTQALPMGGGAARCHPHRHR